MIISGKRHTFVVRNEATYYKICKLIIATDGSINLTFPYHSYDFARVYKFTIDYSKYEFTIEKDQLIDISSIEDEGNLKLSYHFGGFVQFSGRGVFSGKDSNGEIRGIGIETQPLSNPVKGPSIGISFNSVVDFAQTEVQGSDYIQLPEGMSLNDMSQINVVELFIFPISEEYAIINSPNGREWIVIDYPNLGKHQLAIIRPPGHIRSAYFIGVHARIEKNEQQNKAMFSVNGPSGNLREIDGYMFGDSIGCVYPADSEIVGRSLKYIPTEEKI